MTNPIQSVSPNTDQNHLETYAEQGQTCAQWIDAHRTALLWAIAEDQYDPDSEINTIWYSDGQKYECGVSKLPDETEGDFANRAMDETEQAMNAHPPQAN